MQKFKVADGAAADGTAIDRDGFNAGTRYLAKVINDNQWNVFQVVEDAGYTLIDDDLSQLAKALKMPYNTNFTYNTSAIATQTVSDVVKGSDGHYYEVLADGVTNDDPVTNLNGNWKKLPFKVADAVNADEAVSKGQITVPALLNGLNADLVRGLPADFTSGLAVNGYQKLPSGLIIQWGFDTTTYSGGLVTITFPITFPNAVFLVNSNKYINGDTDGGAVSAFTSSMSTTGFSMSTNAAGCVWIAVGY